MATRKPRKNYADRYKKFPTKPYSQRITLATAVDLTQRYRRSAPASEHSGFFFAKGIAELLAQPEVFGMRIYHGLDQTGRYRLVLVGVDQIGEDIVKTRQTLRPTAVARGEEDAVMLDGHLPCPPVCPRNSPLD
ncbi:MAG: hypothetical protein ACT4P7_22650 [Gemmatimonadaceae bacterium]